MTKKIVNTIEYFWSKVRPEVGDACWMWSGYVDKSGYGVFKSCNKSYKAHRKSWSIHYGEIPLGMSVCHKCDVTGCVRPDHLFLGTQADNVIDMIRKGRRRAGVGERNRSAKLTTDDVVDIRKSSIGAKELCLKYGIHESNVRRIRSRRAWSHVP